MPKTSMYEDSRLVLGKHDIRAAGKSGATESIAKAPRMQRFAHKQFDLCIRTPDPRHLRGSLFRGEDICQASGCLL